MQTQSSDQSLQEVTAKLSKNDNVVALLLCGSTATGKRTKSSDYDLVLVVKEKPEKLLSLFTYINYLPADIFFYSLADIKRIISDKQVKEGSEIWLMHWLPKGKVSFDKSGDLSKLQNIISKIQCPLDTSAGTSEYKINYNLVNNTRYFESNDPLYHSALEIRLLYSIVEALVGYFSMRHIYWEGEKKAVQYLEENDPEYLSIFQKTARASNLQDKFTAYRDLVDKSFTSEYPKWDKDVVVSIEGDFGSLIPRKPRTTCPPESAGMNGARCPMRGTLANREAPEKETPYDAKHECGEEVIFGKICLNKVFVSSIKTYCY